MIARGPGQRTNRRGGSALLVGGLLVAGGLFGCGSDGSGMTGSAGAGGTATGAGGRATGSAGAAGGATGSAGAADLSSNRDTAAFTTSGITYQTPSPVEGSTGHGVTLSGGQVTSTQPQQTPTTYSEELWFKATTTTGGILLTDAGADYAQDRIIYMTNTGHLDFGVYPGAVKTIESPGVYNDGKWHFVVATQASDGMHLYVDGGLAASGSTTTAQSYLGHWQLGGLVNYGWPNQPSGTFTGAISDVAVFAKELTAAQVKSEYTSSPAG